MIQPRAVPLTPRQREVVLLLSLGFTYPQIGEELGIANRTVRQHVEDVAQHLPGVGSPKVRVLLALPALLETRAA